MTAQEEKGKMTREILPICVSTYEALCACAEENAEVIYVWRNLHEEMKEKVENTLREFGYVLPGLSTPYGLLFAKKGINLYRTEIAGAEWIF
jgi:hypothetical protein